MRLQTFKELSHKIPSEEKQSINLKENIQQKSDTSSSSLKDKFKIQNNNILSFFVENKTNKGLTRATFIDNNQVLPLARNEKQTKFRKIFNLRRHLKY